MSFSVGKSEKIRNPAYFSDFPENSKNSGHSSSIRSGPSHHSVSFLFSRLFSLFFQKSFSRPVFPENFLFSFFPAVFSSWGKFSRFFSDLFLFLLPFSEHFLFRKCKNTSDKTADSQFFRPEKSERFALIKRIFSFLFPAVFPTVISVFSCCPVKLF